MLNNPILLFLPRLKNGCDVTAYFMLSMGEMLALLSHHKAMCKEVKKMRMKCWQACDSTFICQVGQSLQMVGRSDTTIQVVKPNSSVIQLSMLFEFTKEILLET